jgi:plastocyanin
VTRRFALASLAALLLVPASSGAMDMGADSAANHVSIGFGAVAPATIDVLAGESVDWSNDSVRNHTVTASDGSFASGTIAPGGHFQHMFDSTGDFAYYCSLHPYIRGTVEVRRLLLTRPMEPAASGREYPLEGRSSLAPDTPVSIEFDPGDGSGWRAIADTKVGADGHFTAPLTPTTSGSYRAVSGDDASPSVDLIVLNRSVTASARRNTVTATVAPASPGATVVLQLHLKERFGWWPIAQKRLDKNSRVRFAAGSHRAVRARVVLTLPDGATPLATSNTLRLASVR